MEELFATTKEALELLRGSWDKCSAIIREKDTEIEELKAQATKAERLELENRTLRTQLLDISKQGRERLVSPAKPSRPPLGDLPPNKLSVPQRINEGVPEKSGVDWEQEYATIFKKLEASKTSEDKYKQAATLWRDRSRKWQTRAESLREKNKGLEKRTPEGHGHIQSRSAATETRAAGTGGDALEAHTGDGVEALNRRPAHNINFSPDLDATRSFADHEVDAGRASARHRSEKPVTPAPDPAREIAVGPEPLQSIERDTPPHVHQDRPDGSQLTTSDGTQDSPSLPRLPAGTTEDTMVPVKSEPSSDAIVFVSERRVKRRRVDDAGKLPARRLKSESSSSSDLQPLGQTRRFNSLENMDLEADSRQDKVPTPRINRFAAETVSRPDQSGMMDTFGPPEVNSPSRRPTSRVQNVRAAEPLRLPTSASKSPTEQRSARHRISSPKVGRRGGQHKGRFVRLARAVGDLAEDDVRAAEPLHLPTSASKSPTEQPSARHRIDPLKGRRIGERDKGRLLGLSRAVEDVAEDGETGPASLFRSLGPVELSIPAPGPMTPDILSSLIASAPPTRLIRRVKRDRHELSTPADQHTGDTRATGVRLGPIDNVTRSLGGSVAGKPKSHIGISLGQQTPRPIPLRQRPASSLTLADFKINPKANEGTSFAYNEVVRGKEARASLDGCTNYNCCGRFFSLMARNELEAGGPSLLQQPASIKLLEDYLGDDAHRLGSMNRHEKEELWIEAKMRQQAKRFGRHRDKGPGMRRPTPPGFWDHDMPTTQEMEANKREAKKQEMVVVEERRKEAMRPGGRWLFRDE